MNDIYEKLKDLDYDLGACLYNNSIEEFSIENIEELLAIREGENDGESWIWILKLSDDKFAYVEGWCDFTGWDCMSGVFSTLHDTALQAAGDNKDLIEQIESGKKSTWREETDAVLEIDSKPVEVVDISGISNAFLVVEIVEPIEPVSAFFIVEK